MKGGFNPATEVTSVGWNLATQRNR